MSLKSLDATDFQQRYSRDTYVKINKSLMPGRFENMMGDRRIKQNILKLIGGAGKWPLQKKAIP
jgi:hypothetical protein